MAVKYHTGTRKELFASLVAMVYEGVGKYPEAQEPREGAN
jgi:hypothetical protein